MGLRLQRLRRQQVLPLLPAGLPEPPRTGKGGLPAILTDAMAALSGYMAAPNRYFPILNAINGSTRQQRSERSGACMLLLAACLKYLDLASMRVGVPQENGTMLNLRVTWLAKHAGLSERRAERALRDLKMAGLIDIEQRHHRTGPDTWRGLVALKAVSKDVFAALGMTRRLDIERSKARMRQAMQQAATRRADHDAFRGERERSKAQAPAHLSGLLSMIGRMASAAQNKARRKASTPRGVDAPERPPPPDPPPGQPDRS